VEALLEFLASVDWMGVIVAVVLFAVAVVLGIWVPGRYIERHTNQPAARYVWYGVGTLVLVMIYLAAYGYGLFWNNLNESEKRDPFVFGRRDSTSPRQ
jgi:chromate transport protein ChrA